MTDYKIDAEPGKIFNLPGADKPKKEKPRDPDALGIDVRIVERSVVIGFTRSIASFGLDPKEAGEFGALVQKLAMDIEAKEG